MTEHEAAPPAEEVDLRDLLRRYMRHVGECEGATFVDRLNTDASDMRFSAAEVAMLEEIERW